jgi:hypothetical protein
MPLAIASWRSSATDQRDNGKPRRHGNSQANALIATATLGGKTGRSPATRLFVKARKPLDIEAPTPLADDLAWHAEAGCDAIVTMPLARQQNDLRPHNLPVRQRVVPRPRRQVGSLSIGEDNHVGTLPWHGGILVAEDHFALSCRVAQKYVTVFMKRST